MCEDESLNKEGQLQPVRSRLRLLQGAVLGVARRTLPLPKTTEADPTVLPEAQRARNAGMSFDQRRASLTTPTNLRRPDPQAT